VPAFSLLDHHEEAPLAVEPTGEYATIVTGRDALIKSLLCVNIKNLTNGDGLQSSLLSA
jgi:hypothetical protein